MLFVSLELSGLLEVPWVAVRRRMAQIASDLCVEERQELPDRSMVFGDRSISFFYGER
jgi:hypothetical protein